MLPLARLDKVAIQRELDSIEGDVEETRLSLNALSREETSLKGDRARGFAGDQRLRQIIIERQSLQRVLLELEQNDAAFRAELQRRIPPFRFTPIALDDSDRRLRLGALRRGLADQATINQISAANQARVARQRQPRLELGSIEPFADETISAAQRIAEAVKRDIESPFERATRRVREAEAAARSLGNSVEGLTREQLEEFKRQVGEDLIRELDGVPPAFDEMARRGRRAFGILSSAIEGFATRGEVSLDRLGDALLSFAVRSSLEPFGEAFGDIFAGLFSGGTTGEQITLAKGAAIESGRVLRLARGGVIDRPIVFPLAHGAALAGEAGPEGILPLRRLPSGDLGVQATGGGVNVTVINNTGEPVQTRRRRGAGGRIDIEVEIGRMVARQISTPGTPANQALERTFGLAQQPVMR